MKNNKSLRALGYIITIDIHIAFWVISNVHRHLVNGSKNKTDEKTRGIQH